MAEVDINVQAAIAQGASLSAQADIGNKSIVALVLPAAWVAAAGGLSFQVSVEAARIGGS